MVRWLTFLLLAGIFAGIAAWFANHPGLVSLQWEDYRIETSVAVLLALVVVLAAVVAAVYRLWWTLLRVPRAFARSGREGRQRRGVAALSRGLVAVAAGDAETAQHQARRASSLLDDRRLTLLLSAQAAQLQGDEQAASRFFTAMRERRDTEFLGVRGLLSQAMKRNDRNEALELAKQAHRLNPRSGWVVSTLYELQKQTGHWADAEVTLGECERLKLMPPETLGKERGQIQYELSVAADGERALRLARSAYRADPSLLPAAIRWAELLVAEGRHRKAQRVIETVWGQTPDPLLAEVYWRAAKADTDAKKVQAAKKLAMYNFRHIESRLAVAAAAVDAKMWSEARSQLEPVAGDDAPPRICRLMARLEEGEHGDLVRARAWLLRAAGEKPAPPLVPPPPAPPALESAAAAEPAAEGAAAEARESA
jgi:HemY protein